MGSTSTADPETQATGPARPPGRTWIKLFSLRGVGVFLDPLLVLLLLAVALLGEDRAGVVSRTTLVGVLLGSVLLHELGHALTARHRGLAVSGVYLHLLPFAYVERGAPRDELVVALAGPATSLLVALACAVPLALGPGLPEARLDAWFEHPLALAVLVNGLMGAVNLLPLPALDGGRALRALRRS